MLDSHWLDLGYRRYQAAFAIQEQALQARLAGRLSSLVIIQENPPTFTIGRAGTTANLLVPPAELAARGVEVIEASRGGDVTYHGPGQLIASPLLYLGDLGLNANQYLHRLEEVLFVVLASYGLIAKRREGYPGAWLGPAKVGAVGIGVRHGYTFHGLSLNVNLDLTPFTWINPCGVPAMPVTSMQATLGRSVSLAHVSERLREALKAVFCLNLTACSPEALGLSWKN